MKRAIMLASTQEEYIAVEKCLNGGWVLDPALTDNKPYRLESSTVWPLVLYKSEDEKPKPEAKIGPLEDVESIVSVDLNQADLYLKDGYTVHETFAKTVTLIKRRSAVSQGAKKDEGL